MSNQLVTVSNAEVYRASTDAAGLCRDIVLKTAQNIQGRKYVKVEGWQAIAIAHGCVASAEDVQRVNDDGMSGFRATGTVRRMSDGALISQAEGFVGDDESMWAKRPVYARRAMVQTRAISRACRSAFAHVVVLIDANLSTTPAEEVPHGGFEEMRDVTPRTEPKAATQAPGRTVNPNSANQAKKDGRGERANTLAHEIDDLNEVTDCLAWKMMHVDEVGTWPKPWATALWEKWDLQISELRRIAAMGASEEETMFSETDSDGVAGDDVEGGARVAAKAHA